MGIDGRHGQGSDHLAHADARALRTRPARPLQGRSGALPDRDRITVLGRSGASRDRDSATSGEDHKARWRRLGSR
ncbi:hypothetical protein LA76x_4774 [Lysobacter antibioticus]|uniref:Uncharacterized protein n=1 Tax=Lysobacter antibioticus TaxID=84531 RepID=A0A0S2FH60_LYSAN|nr:hypothetical protein LA76x_4774 [Lysobacter antibioticus]